jgi:hypothetical protein
MSRNAIVIGIAFFVLSIIGKDVASAGIQLWYRINREEIAKEHCVNKSRPELKCDGKCYLVKQLAKVEGNPVKEKAPKQSLKVKACDWVAQPFACVRAMIVPEETEVPFHDISFGGTRNFHEEIFHPPCC